jgi:TRAP-type uncharacterized transport system fused permease subunit
MLFINTTPFKVIQIVLSSCIGMFGLAAGLEGYMARKLGLPLRLAAVAGGLFLIDPGLVTDLIGIGLIAAVTVEQVIFRKQKNIVH